MRESSEKAESMFFKYRELIAAQDSFPEIFIARHTASVTLKQLLYHAPKLSIEAEHLNSPYSLVPMPSFASVVKIVVQGKAQALTARLRSQPKSELCPFCRAPLATSSRKNPDFTRPTCPACGSDLTTPNDPPPGNEVTESFQDTPRPDTTHPVTPPGRR
ncbi:hypothetical protein HYFRA_00006960 [Hymenoscyphus fraxineus]|uniref:Uncharacterized protein n=1 Tax=Hymenoscyphus fraxineus TaxID=746836 RepID=A0A9N9PFJ0_9HELO|nr:hypothetical protein HYFRA_00006960 [Hymenoscyphus fraxineus]